MLDGELDKILLRLIQQWNIAERRIKKAEQVQGGFVVGSAVFELRYAGRKIIDAITLSFEGDISKDAALHGRVRVQLEDAVEDCVKAKHDAIDATLSFVTIWFDKVERKLGLGALLELFPDYVDLTSKIKLIQDKIATSREDRNAGRDGLYDEIEKSGFDEILALFDQMQTSKERVERLVKRRKIKDGIIFWATITVAVGTVLLLALEAHLHWSEILSIFA